MEIKNQYIQETVIDLSESDLRQIVIRHFADKYGELVSDNFNLNSDQYRFAFQKRLPMANVDISFDPDISKSTRSNFIEAVKSKVIDSIDYRCSSHIDDDCNADLEVSVLSADEMEESNKMVEYKSLWDPHGQNTV